MADLNCGAGGGADDLLGLRIASVFIIMAGSTGGALFPVIARRSSWLHVPKPVFDFAKYFGSGVIIGTAFIHLLSPALDALGSECLPESWRVYPYALAFCLISIFMIFIVELVAFRWGTERLTKLGVHHDAHGHQSGALAAHGPEGGFPGRSTPDEKSDSHTDLESNHRPSVVDDVTAQLLGIAILEFGVAFHSILIGLTLAVDPEFKILFVVLVFHQTFEGLGIGSRLAFMKLPPKYNWIAYAGAVIYGLTTPVGIAAGLGVRSSYNPGSTTASIVSGVMDSLSAGILVYTGLVELLAHDFLFNKEMMNASNKKVAYALFCILLGCGLMSLLGRWA